MNDDTKKAIKGFVIGLIISSLILGLFLLLIQSNYRDAKERYESCNYDEYTFEKYNLPYTKWEWKYGIKNNIAYCYKTDLIKNKEGSYEFVEIIKEVQKR